MNRTMNAPAGLLGGAVAFACALAACGGGVSNSTPAVTQCALPAGTAVALAYPVPGASAVPDAPGQIVIATSTALQNTWHVVLNQSNGTSTGEGVVETIVASAVPTPFATPSFANPTYQASLLTGALPSATTITVLLHNQSVVCTGLSIGSFTTQ
jgi:hypothetical protein